MEEDIAIPRLNSKRSKDDWKKVREHGATNKKQRETVKNRFKEIAESGEIVPLRAMQVGTDSKGALARARAKFAVDAGEDRSTESIDSSKRQKRIIRGIQKKASGLK